MPSLMLGVDVSKEIMFEWMGIRKKMSDEWEMNGNKKEMSKEMSNEWE